jgi:uncharacterized protein (TIGR00251 family)
VKARSKEARLIIEADGTIILHVVAPAEGGRANREIVKWFAKKLSLPASQVRLVAGLRSRSKVLEIYGVDEAEVKRALTSLCR